MAILLQWDVSRALSCSYTRCAVANLAISYSELSNDVANHLRDDFDAMEVFAVMDGDGEVDHLGEDDHVTALCTNDNVIALALSLASLSQFGEQFLLTWREASLESAPSPGWKKFDEGVHVHLD